MDIPVDKIAGAHSWLSSVVLSATVALERDGVDVTPIYERAKRDKLVGVRITVDGHEVPAEFFFERFGPAWDESVDRRARELVEERMGEKLRAIDDELDELRRATQAQVRDHFPLWCNDDE